MYIFREYFLEKARFVVNYFEGGRCRKIKRKSGPKPFLKVRKSSIAAFSVAACYAPPASSRHRLHSDIFPTLFYK